MIFSNSFHVVSLIILCLGGHFTQAEFAIYDGSTFDNSLGANCIEALATSIDCDTYVQTFSEPRYRGELDLELTDNVCSAECGGSLKAWFDTVDT
jgi:hypothetical protein